MKKKTINILKITIKLTLVFIIALGAYECLNKIFYNKDVYRAEDYRGLPENSMDVIVLGSSHAQYSFVPSFFYEETGLNSYVLGSACQPFPVSYEMLKEALKTQKPQVVILEALTALPLRNSCYNDSCYILAEYEMTGDEKMNVINMLPEEKAENYKNDFLTYHNDWRTFGLKDEAIVEDDDESEESEISITTYGYVLQTRKEMHPENWWHANTYGYTVDVEMREEDMEALNNIFNLCEENGIKLVLYKTPVDSYTREDQSALEIIWNWAEERDVDYVDFIEESKELSFYINIHSDSYHANIDGASIITERLSQLVNTYKLASKDADVLENEYGISERVCTEKVLEYESYPYQYLKRLKDTSGVVVISYSGSDEPLYNSLYNSLVSLGLDESICKKDDEFYAIVIDGKVEKQGNESIQYSDELYNITCDNTQITVNGYEVSHETSLLLAYYNIDDDKLIAKQIDQSANMDKGAQFYDWDNDLAF